MLSLSPLIMVGFWLHGTRVVKEARKSKNQQYISSIEELSELNKNIYIKIAKVKKY